MRIAQLFFIFHLTLTSCAAALFSDHSADPAALQPGNYNLKMEVDGLERTYILHIPPAARDSQPIPLVIVLHGSYGTGRKMQLLGFDGYANSRGFLTAYPDAYHTPDQRQTARWNDGRGTLESSAKGIDDVKFITALVDEIAHQTPVDRSLVFVTGASNGGMMTYRLGCETRGIFAGIAPVIGNLPEPISDTCNPQAPISILAINGEADPLIPFDGGEVCAGVRFGCEGGWVASQSESLLKFAKVNGCALEPEQNSLPVLVDDGTSVDKQSYPDCSAQARVQALVIHNGGHTWPPHASQLAVGGQKTGNLDATRAIVDFFIPEE